MMLRSKWLRWQVTPSILGSGTASITMLLPVQSFLKLPTSSALANPGARPAAQSATMAATCLIDMDVFPFSVAHEARATGASEIARQQRDGEIGEEIGDRHRLFAA